MVVVFSGQLTVNPTGSEVIEYELDLKLNHSLGEENEFQVPTWNLGTHLYFPSTTGGRY